MAYGKVVALSQHPAMTGSQARIQPQGGQLVGGLGGKWSNFVTAGSIWSQLSASLTKIATVGVTAFGSSSDPAWTMRTGPAESAAVYSRPAHCGQKCRRTWPPDPPMLVWTAGSPARLSWVSRTPTTVECPVPVAFWQSLQ